VGAALALYAVVVDGRSAPREARIERGAIARTLVTPAEDHDAGRKVAAVTSRPDDVPVAGGALQTAAPSAAPDEPAHRVAGVGRGGPDEDRGPRDGNDRDRSGGDRPDDPVLSPAPITTVPTPTPAPQRGGDGNDPSKGDEPDDGAPQRTAWEPEPTEDDAED
jgi:hypothetical protein